MRNTLLSMLLLALFGLSACETARHNPETNDDTLMSVSSQDARISSDSAEALPESSPTPEPTASPDDPNLRQRLLTEENWQETLHEASEKGAITEEEQQTILLYIMRIRMEYNALDRDTNVVTGKTIEDILKRQQAVMRSRKPDQ